MADESALAASLDKELDEFIKDKIENPSGPTMNDDFLDMDPETLANELKQHPAFMTEFDETKPLSPAMEGLQALKYDSDSAEVNASSYKDDGNNQFKRKKYHWAIENYTKGIQFKSKNKELNAILYCNRAASHFHLGNFRSALNDSIYARKFKPDHMKAILRGAQCCFELNKFGQCIKLCDDGLMVKEKDSNLLAMRGRAETHKRKLEKEKRKEQTKERRNRIEVEKLVQAIQDRGVHLERRDKESNPETRIESIESHHPSGAKVKLDQNNKLIWPVYFMYSEFGETDFIEAYHEDSRFQDHIDAMFGENNTPGWDSERKYTPESIVIYFEDREKEKLIGVNKNYTLAEALKMKGYVIRGGTPAFILLVKGSKFAEDFFSKYH